MRRLVQFYVLAPCFALFSKTETFENYNVMLTVRVFWGNPLPKEAIDANIKEIEKRKETDLVASYIAAKNNCKDILEFIVSDGSDDYTHEMEADAHYYQQVKREDRETTLPSLYSTRAYDDYIIPFIQSIPSIRAKWYKPLQLLGSSQSLINNKLDSSHYRISYHSHDS